MSFAFTRIAEKARHARAWRDLAKDFRACAKHGLSPTENMRNARRCEAKARDNEGAIRAYADSLLSKGMR